MKTSILLLVIILTFTASSSSAEKAPAETVCDGYPPLKATSSDDLKKLLPGGEEVLIPSAINSKDIKSSITYCTEALNSPAIKNNWLREANLLKARSAYHLIDGEIHLAKKDIQEAKKLITPHIQKSEIKLGIYISTLLLEAIANRLNIYDPESLLKSGELTTEAISIAPWSKSLYFIAAKQLPASYILSVHGEDLFKNSPAISPNLIFNRADFNQWRNTNLEDSYNDFQHLTKNNFKITILPPQTTFKRAKKVDTEDPTIHLYAAMAAARINKNKEALEHIKEAQDILSGLLSSTKLYATPKKEYSLKRQIKSSKLVVQGFHLFHSQKYDELLNHLKENQPNLITNSLSSALISDASKVLKFNIGANFTINNLSNTLSADSSRKNIRKIYELSPPIANKTTPKKLKKKLKLKTFKSPNSIKISINSKDTTIPPIEFERITLKNAALITQKQDLDSFEVIYNRSYDTYLQTYRKNSPISSKLIKKSQEISISRSYTQDSTPSLRISVTDALKW